jgi:hypothetical protein
MKYLCDMDSDPLMQDISNSLNAEAVRLLAAVITNNKHKPKGRRWNFKDKILLSLSLSVAQNPVSFSRHYSLFHQDKPCKLSSILFSL